jgi:sulfite reductase (NADPH) hemoprotein beta-component
MQAKVKAKGSAQPLLVTANRLRDGRVVWLAADGGWTEAVRDAAVFAGEQVETGLARGQEAELHQLVVGPYAVEVTLGAAGPVPLRMRERVRLDGPSVLPQAAE